MRVWLRLFGRSTVLEAGVVFAVSLKRLVASGLVALSVLKEKAAPSLPRGGGTHRGALD